MQKYVLNPIVGDFDLVDIQTKFYNTLLSFPAVGQSNLLYVAKDTGKVYYWNGSAYTLSNIPNLQEVTDVSGNTSNVIVVNRAGVGQTRVLGGTVENTQSGSNFASTIDSNSVRVESLLNGFNTDLIFPIPTQNNILNLPNANGTIALTSDIPNALTPEQIQDSAFAILTDTLTIDLTYDDSGNQVTANVIDNSITNNKLSQAPANSVKSNPTNAIANEQDLLVLPNSVVGRDNDVNGGNLTSLPLQKTLMGVATLISGDVNVIDSNITTSSIVVGISISGTGSITSVPIRWTATNGQMNFNTGQISDTATFGYTILI